jgi:hypothetical protein
MRPEHTKKKNPAARAGFVGWLRLAVYQ